LLGPPGAGKGTQALKLAEKLGVPQISTGDLFRSNITRGTELGLEAKHYLDAGDLVPSDLTNALVEKRLDEADAADGFILDGYPRSVEQAEALTRMLGARNTKLDAVLEFRVCDLPMRVDETIALAALIQATVAKLYKLYSQNQGFRLYRKSLLMENKWRAARYGINGKLIDFGKQIEVPARDLIREYLEFVDDVVDELDSREELNYIHTMLDEGSGADRQLRVYRETGDLKKVVDYIIEETETGLEADEPVSERRVG